MNNLFHLGQNLICRLSTNKPRTRKAVMELQIFYYFYTMNQAEPPHSLETSHLIQRTTKSPYRTPSSFKTTSSHQKLQSRQESTSTSTPHLHPGSLTRASLSTHSVCHTHPRTHHLSQSSAIAHRTVFACFHVEKCPSNDILTMP